MRFKVELYPDLARDLRYRWPPDEVEAFYSRLNEVLEDPIEQSEAISEPSLSRYMLRFFRFGAQTEKIAIFGLDATIAKIRVVKCRPLKTGKWARSDRPAGRGKGGRTHR